MIAVARLGRGLRRIAAGVRGLLRSEERIIELASIQHIYKEINAHRRRRKERKACE